MERTALPRPVGVGSWYPATLVALRQETWTARTLRFEVPGWPGHLPGQHVDVRLTAEDGYVARRSYSLSAPADGETISMTVQLVEDGEVSPYLVEEMELGDQLEVLGPVGGWFVWPPGPAASPDRPGPVLLIGGGSGVAPLWAIREARLAQAGSSPTRLLYSARTPREVLYARDVLAAPDAHVLYTREAPPGTDRVPRRVDARDLAEYGLSADQRPTCYVCGPTPFVEHVTQMLVEAGHDPANVRAERFGATGG